MSDTIVQMNSICKVYSNGIVANDDAVISVAEGEIHALAGENGAGKSTLMKILFGLEKPTSGEILIRGERVTISSPLDAARLGIGMVHQHFMLVDELTVADNIVLGHEPMRAGLVDRRRAAALVRELSKKFGMPIEPDAVVGSLSVVQKQKVEILKVLSLDCKIIILDEPTAVLTPQETAELFEQLKLLKKSGYTIIIITHKLGEIKQICDRITVMRAGRFVGADEVRNLTEEDISRMMVGRDVVRTVAKTHAQPAETVLSVEGLSLTAAGGKRLLQDVTFECKKGEIVCLCGVEGNGQREVVSVVTGIERGYAGSVSICGRDIKGMTTAKIRKLGATGIPEDRLKYGVDPKASIADNLISTSLGSMTDAAFLNGRRIADMAEKSIESYGIRCDGASQLVGMLSGGNMQKVVIARETSGGPSLVIADQPTRGVDVGAIEFIHKKLVEIRDAGAALLVVSSDLSEVLALSDSIIVFHQGNIVARFPDPSAVDEQELGLYMLGVKTMEGERI